jgi:carboxyl-terminal processing protease
VVLDLRGNRGGVLAQAVGVASLFLADGVIARTDGRHPDAARTWGSVGPDLAQGVPVVVLIDGRTASSAEILAAALADRARAVAVGSVTTGKGLIQAVIALPNGGELLLSWSRVLAPLGWPIQGLGVLPAICTSLGPETLAQELAELRRGEPPLAEALSSQRALKVPVPAREISRLRDRCPPAEGREADAAIARALFETPGDFEAALPR